ncbi:ABC transporter ATP-binding protein [Ostreiculturibacter nitratireducens]|uniref:ABC transporter ATP-binding protein n=1 Tax=Ostreiculturibacter nitratireducens TaxID=3075226 RepID=UPI0031B59A52
MIKLENLTKVFKVPGREIVAADHINMEVPEGEICVLLGPSGCGKTTALKMINRLIAPTSGKIYINGKDTDAYRVTELRRSIGYVIQQIGLFPNMTIEENICVVPKMLGWDMKRARQRAAELLDLVALEPAMFLNRYPKELSGGQQQRVGVIRALAADPPVMLMDEPFGAIDPINREVIQDEFLKMQDKLKKTIMFVSHDIDEAVKMGDKIAIFRGGKLEQFDSPDQLLAHPANDFIADFVGADRTLKRLRLLKAEAAIDPSALAVNRDTSLRDLRAMMTERHADAAVLLDEAGKVAGQITGEAASAEGVAAQKSEPVHAVVKASADLREVVSVMFANDTTWLPVVGTDGRFQGVVTQAQITHLLGETYRQRQGAGAH